MRTESEAAAFVEDDRQVGAEVVARSLAHATGELTLPEDATGKEGPDASWYVRIQDSQTIGHDFYPLTFRVR